MAALDLTLSDTPARLRAAAPLALARRLAALPRAWLDRHRARRIERLAADRLAQLPRHLVADIGLDAAGLPDPPAAPAPFGRGAC